VSKSFAQEGMFWADKAFAVAALTHRRPERDCTGATFFEWLVREVAKANDWEACGDRTAVHNAGMTRKLLTSTLSELKKENLQVEVRQEELALFLWNKCWLSDWGSCLVFEFGVFGPFVVAPKHLRLLCEHSVGEPPTRGLALCAALVVNWHLRFVPETCDPEPCPQSGVWQMLCAARGGVGLTLEEATRRCKALVVDADERNGIHDHDSAWRLCDKRSFKRSRKKTAGWE
jgi:hypothetical protein